VTGRADGKVFGDAFDDSEDEGLPSLHDFELTLARRRTILQGFCD